MKKRRYQSPEARAKKLVAEIIAASVDMKYTKADNAFMLLKAVELICSAYDEQQRREPQLWADILD